MQDSVQEGQPRGRRKQMIGVVVGNKMDKTAVVAVERRMRHPLYRKIVRRTTKYKVHDAGNTSNLGDIVRIVETRPMSKEKRWRIAEVLTRGNVAELKPTEIGTTEVAEVSGVMAPEATQGKAPEAALENVPEAVPEKAPEVALEKAPEAVPEKAPEAALEKAPEATLEKVPEAALEKAPEAALEKAPEAAQEAAPE